MCEDDFEWVVFSGWRPDKKKVVERVRKFLGQKLWNIVRWHVPGRERVQYENAGARNVVAASTSADAVNLALRLATELTKPCVVLADDVSGLSDCTCSPTVWKTRYGVTLRPFDAAKRLVHLCDKFGSKLGGVFPLSNPYWQLRFGPYSFSAFIVADFFIAMPNIHTRWSDQMRPKEDYDFTCRILQDEGIVVRSNWIGVKAQHHRPGGDGCGKARLKKDLACAADMVKTWNRPAKNEIVVKIKPSKPSEISLNGLVLVKRKHPELAKVLRRAAKAYKDAHKVSKRQLKQVLLRGAKKTRATTCLTSGSDAQVQRVKRGTGAQGSERRAGPRPAHGRSLSASTRTALYRVARTVRDAVLSGA